MGDFHSVQEARGAAEEFERRFSRKEVPEVVEEWMGHVPEEGQRLTALMVAAGMAKSGSAATRVLSQGGVKIDGVRVEDRFHTIAVTHGPFVLQVGKRALRIKVTKD